MLIFITQALLIAIGFHQLPLALANGKSNYYELGKRIYSHGILY